ncbi:MAG: ribbon-helix-helix domain-containing protein [Candidatus Nezhaarchaeota archaeon]|nr:ribbon-helix-helix domain-containing protein [Candidatus Nezhaarchaeota archaeon]
MPSKSELRVVSVHLPEAYIDGLNKLIDLKLYPNRSEAIRAAIRDLLRKELWERPPRRTLAKEAGVDLGQRGRKVYAKPSHPPSRQ